MAKITKEQEWRLQGMTYALEVAKKEGVEGLERDMKRRGLIQAPIGLTQKQIDIFTETCARNLYSNMLATFAYAMHELYGFGGDRIKKLRDFVEKMVTDTMDLDYMGEHYIRLEDYAIELNEKYKLGIDVDAIAECQEIQDEKESNYYHYGKVEAICEELENNGFAEAARFLAKKIER